MKRWLRWNIHCWRGRRCANVVALPPSDTDDRPPGATVYINYMCAGCGTNYQWNERTRKRVVVA